MAVSLPALVSVKEVQRRLKLIFPETFPDRAMLVGQLAARAVLYFSTAAFWRAPSVTCGLS